MQEERSGSEQQHPEHPTAWAASSERAGDWVPPGGGADQAWRSEANPEPGHGASGDEHPAGVYPGTPPQPDGYAPPGGGYGASGGGYAPPGGGYAPPGGGYAPPGGGYRASGGGYAPPGGGHDDEGGGYGYQRGYPGSSHPGGPGYAGPGYQGGYSDGGYFGSGYQGGYAGSAGYPGGYQDSGHPGGPGYGGYPPGDPGYGMPGGYGGAGGGYGQERPKRTNRIITYVLVAALAAGVGAGTVLAMRHSSSNASHYGYGLPGPGAIPQPGSGAGPGSSSKSNAQAVTRAVGPGIVDVISTPSYQPGGTLEGTGMVINSDGLVLTNNHVIEGTTRELAKIADTGRQYRVTVLGTDATDDIALLKLDGASNLKTVPIGDSSTARVGQPIVALGNAEGEDGPPSVVTGSITNLDRSITANDAGADTTENLHGMLQTNAPIVEGDSGGALASMQGKVIGMNTAANTGTTGAPGTSMGFAIPINRALSIARQIAAGQTTAQIQLGYPAFLGVTVATGKAHKPSTSASPQVQLQQLKQQAGGQPQGGFGGLGGSGGGSGGGCLSTNQASVPSSIPNVSSGVLAGGVLCHTPVRAAGMTGGAVITAIGGHPVTSPASLTTIMAGYHPGQTVSVKWVSPGGQHHTSTLKLAAGPAK